jgi:RsiW-degrading membrane proteinase PrsW (M82 family)
MLDSRAEVLPASPVETQPAAATRPRVTYLVLGVLLALLGGALGILGAFVQELLSMISVAPALLYLALPFIGAPVIEEALKPTGIYILLARWPQAVRNQLHIASLTALSGLCFGIIESLVYVLVYYPEGGSDFELYRFTVTPAMHTAASFMVGLGLNATFIDWTAGRAKLPRRTRNAYLSGVLLHAAYNTVAVALAVAGVLEFD